MGNSDPTQPTADPATNEPTNEPTNQPSIINEQSNVTKKIVILGNGGSGQSTWFQKVNDGHFGNGVQFGSFNVTSSSSDATITLNATSSASGATTTLNVWDTAGNECDYVGAHGFVFLFDEAISNHNQTTSWSKLAQFLVFLKNHSATTGGSPPPVKFVVNICDVVTLQSGDYIHNSIGTLINFIMTQGQMYVSYNFSFESFSVNNASLSILLSPLIELL